MRFEGKIKLYGEEDEINKVVSFFSFLNEQDEEYENNKYESLLSEDGFPSVNETRKEILFDFTNSSLDFYDNFQNFFMDYSETYPSTVFKFFAIFEYGEDTRRLQIQNGDVIFQKENRPLN